MSSSLLCIILVLLLGSACAQKSITGCMTINTPGSYILSADFTYTSSQTNACIYIVDTTIPGNTSISINGNNKHISCVDPAGCAPAILVDPSSTMKLYTWNAIWIQGKFNSHIVDGGNNCYITFLLIQQFTTMGDVVRCGSGNITISGISISSGYVGGSFINAPNASYFQINGNSVNSMFGFNTGIVVANGTGTINQNSFQYISATPDCNFNGYDGYGESTQMPAASCNDILRKRGVMPNGVYYVYYTAGYIVVPVYCDFTMFPGRAATLMYKLNDNVNSGYNPATLWTAATTSGLNDGDNSLLGITKKSTNYVSRVVAGSVALNKVSIRAYTQGELLMFIDFKNGTSSKTDFFVPSRIINSSYIDLPTSDTFHNSSNGRKFIVNNGNQRAWYINSANSDCMTDQGWVMVGAASTQSYKDQCRDTWWPPANSDTNLNHILVSTTTGASLLRDLNVHTLAEVFALYADINDAAGFQGIAVSNVANVTINGNTFDGVNAGSACPGSTSVGHTSGIRVTNSAGVTINSNSFQNVYSGMGADADTYAIYTSNCVNTDIKYNTMFRVQGSSFWGNKWVGTNGAPIYAVYVDNGVQTNIVNNSINTVGGVTAGDFGNASATVGFHVNTQGGNVINNTLLSVSGGFAGATTDSSPGGTCGSTFGFEIVDSTSVSVSSNTVNGVYGCFAGGHSGSNADGPLGNGGTSAGFWITNSTVSLSLNYVTGGGAGYSNTQGNYGGAAFAYYVDSSLTMYYRNSASQISAGFNGSSLTNTMNPDTVPILKTAQVSVPGGPCDANVTAAEMCYPAGTSCCSATCRAKSSSIMCRDAVDSCDSVDYCSFGICVDNKKSSGTVCRAKNGTCDIVETCDGVSNSCPTDAFITSAGSSCTPYCGRQGTCDGASKQCSTDAYCDQHCLGNSPCTELTACGTISTAGFYYLARDLVLSPGSTCFTVNANNVAMRGEGHTLTCPQGQNCQIGINGNYGYTSLSVTQFVITGRYMGGVNCYGNCTVDSCSFTGSNDGAYGIQMANIGTPGVAGLAKVTNNNFTSVWVGYSIYLGGGLNITVNGNTFTNNTGTGAIYAELATSSWPSSSSGSITNNVITNYTGSFTQFTCCGPVGMDLHVIFTKDTKNVRIANNTVQNVYPRTGCGCNNTVSAPSSRSRGGWVGAISVTRSTGNIVTGNTISNVYGSNGYVAGMLSGVYFDYNTANNTVSYNTISNLFGGTAELKGNTSDLHGILVQGSSVLTYNSISSIYGGFIPDSNSSGTDPAAWGWQGTIYGIKVEPATWLPTWNCTMANNQINNLVGMSGANVRAPWNGTAMGGQSVIGVYSLGSGLSISNTIVTSLSSGPAGISDIGLTWTPGSAIGINILNKLYAYSNGSVSNFTVPDYAVNVSSSAPTAVSQPVQAVGITGCAMQNYDGDEFCYPIGNGCFRTCQFHQCNLQVSSYTMEASCTDDSAMIYMSAYDSDPFQYTVNGVNLTDSATGTVNVTLWVPRSNATYTIRFNDSFDCVASIPVYIPANTAPKAIAAPAIDFSSGMMNISATPRNGSDAGGILPVTGYIVEYRTSCSGVKGPWIPIYTDADNITNGIVVSRFYQTTYEARVTVQNCRFNSTASPFVNATSPENPALPLITGFEPATGLPTAGGQITLIGTNFPDSDFYVIVDGGRANCANATNRDVNTTTCDVPPGVGVGHSIQIVLDPAVYFSCVPQVSNIFAWVYAVPQVNNTSHMSTAGGSLTIYGTNFGSTNDTPIVTIDEAPCSNCSVLYNNGTAITCDSCPSGYEQHPLVVAVADQPSVPFQFSYPICTPVCMYGTCMGNDTTTYCQCLPGYTGPSCSEEIVCAAPVKSRCGLCSGGKCCFFRSKM